MQRSVSLVLFLCRFYSVTCVVLRLCAAFWRGDGEHSSLSGYYSSLKNIGMMRQSRTRWKRDTPSVKPTSPHIRQVAYSLSPACGPWTVGGPRRAARGSASKPNILKCPFRQINFLVLLLTHCLLLKDCRSFHRSIPNEYILHIFIVRRKAGLMK